MTAQEIWATHQAMPVGRKPTIFYNSMVVLSNAAERSSP
jgi:hypothetical protein